ncbi:MAG: hypothetical protein Q9214_001746 [Letrouitia sp. 1 TL-2023]
MSLPGLQLSAPVESVSIPVIHELREGSEWRFEVAFGSKVDVKLLSGSAELFGTELAQKQTYTFAGTKAAIYTWHGCSIEVIGDCQVDYSAEETPMISYANLHLALERLRDEAVLHGRDGPRVLVLGPENAGKSTLVKLLTAYATRCGRLPLTANLDPKESMLSLPGSISASAFSSIIDVEDGWGSSPTNGPSQVPVKLPLVYYYGLANPEQCTAVFKPIVKRLAVSVMSRLHEDPEAKSTGCLVDTPGIISQGKGNYEIIQHIVAEFEITVLVVLGSERLYSDMAKKFGQKSGTNQTANVIKLDKSGGCVDRDEDYLRQLRQAQVREYFFGDAKSALSPHTQQVDFAYLAIYKITESLDMLNALLPGGEDDEDISAAKPLFEKVQPTPQMQNGILAIVHAEVNDSPDRIRDASVMGFVYVAEVDEKRKKVKVLAPLSGRLAQKAMIWGSWPENIGELVG